MLKFQKVAMFLFLLTASFAPFFADAQYSKPQNSYGTYNPADGSQGLPNAIIYVTQIILGVVAVLAILFIVIGGVMYIVSAGGDTEKAKNMIFNAIIGLVVALLAFAIVKGIGGYLEK